MQESQSRTWSGSTTESSQEILVLIPSQQGMPSRNGLANQERIQNGLEKPGPNQNGLEKPGLNQNGLEMQERIQNGLVMQERIQMPQTQILSQSQSLNQKPSLSLLEFPDQTFAPTWLTLLIGDSRQERRGQSDGKRRHFLQEDVDHSYVPQ